MDCWGNVGPSGNVKNSRNSLTQELEYPISNQIDTPLQKQSLCPVRDQGQVEKTVDSIALTTTATELERMTEKGCRDSAILVLTGRKES